VSPTRPAMPDLVVLWEVGLLRHEVQAGTRLGAEPRPPELGRNWAQTEARRGGGGGGGGGVGGVGGVAGGGWVGLGVCGVCVCVCGGGGVSPKRLGGRCGF
jgi:hypothetical protein